MITVIKNGTVITMDPKRKNKYEQLDIVIENDKIKEITKEYKGKYDKIINAKNKIVMPGLINAHTHLGMSIFRATNDNLTSRLVRKQNMANRKQNDRRRHLLCNTTIMPRNDKNRNNLCQ